MLNGHYYTYILVNDGGITKKQYKTVQDYVNFGHLHIAMNLPPALDLMV